eukprot:TRINITY_DN4830_c0_g1_i4.p2 TRINITY_DN4830_c0_g1~~TRINITY_DN4830_c0_g1_i4.p2  ORF type:complete len:164 (+),score=64.13 TRINITY_DN4830_c0_g1_i4:59-493(+)
MRVAFIFVALLACFAVASAQKAPAPVSKTPSPAFLLREYLADRFLDADNSTVALKPSFGAANGLSCTVCQKVVGFLEGKINKYGCKFFFKAAAVAACEAAGLGPEDPMSEVCIGVMIASCKEIASLIEGHITDSTAICQHLHIC